MPRKKSNKKKRKEKESSSNKKEGSTSSSTNTSSAPSSSTTTPTRQRSNMESSPVSKRQLFITSPTIKSSTKNANHQALRILNLARQWQEANVEGRELMSALRGLSGRMSSLDRLSSIHQSARTDVLTLFHGLHDKVKQRHVEDLEDVFHNLRILLNTQDEIATNVRECYTELQTYLHRFNHDSSSEELSILFGPPEIDHPVPFETVVRAALHLSSLYTNEFWYKMDLLNQIRIDETKNVDSIVNKWLKESSKTDPSNCLIVDGFLTQLSCLERGTFGERGNKKR
jgi:hypothetical protein